MTRLLVSVRDAEEAAIALAGGADLIDVKEPRLGSLGAATSQAWREVTAVVGNRVPLSAALGELLPLADCDEYLALGHYQFAKLGLAGCAIISGWRDQWIAQLRKLPSGVTSVAVAYADFEAADAPDVFEVLESGYELGCRALLVDTFRKDRGNVFQVLDQSVLREAFVEARRRGMLTAIAGSLRIDQFEQAISLEPDIVAVRGAVCGGTREAKVDSALVYRAKQALAAIGCSS